MIKLVAQMVLFIISIFKCASDPPPMFLQQCRRADSSRPLSPHYSPTTVSVSPKSSRRNKCEITPWMNGGSSVPFEREKALRSLCSTFKDLSHTTCVSTGKMSERRTCQKWLGWRDRLWPSLRPRPESYRRQEGSMCPKGFGGLEESEIAT